MTVSTSISRPPLEPYGCPTRDELIRLLSGELNPDDVERCTAHVGDCSTCQSCLDSIATGEHPALPQLVRGIDKNIPPKQSALWRIMDHAENQPPINMKDSSLTTETIAPELKLNFLQPSSNPDHLGRINRFDIIKVIGQGGMGVVLQAFDPSLQREVAVKVLDPILANNPNYRKRFCREARAAASVSHENIVAVYQVEQDDTSDLPYMVMQLVTGESLEQRLRRVTRLSVPEVVRIGAQAAAGLAAAHATGLIHRDVKPGNMLLEAGTDRLRLTDFGLARAHEDLRLTKPGYVSGTPLYMAPEQARGDNVDQRADLFSLGVVLYECLAGRPPFDGKTPLVVLKRVADEPHVPLGNIIPDIPEWFEDVIDRLLTKNPAKRFHTAVEVMEILSQHVPQTLPPECGPTPANAGSSHSSHRSNLSRTARRKLKYKLVVLMTLSLIVGLALGGTGMWAFAPFRIPKSPSDTASVAPMITVAEHDHTPLARLSIPGNSGAVWAVAACPDNHSLAMGLEDGRILIYDILEKKVRATLDAHRGAVWGLEFFPDAKRFVSASDDGSVNVWELGKAKPIQSLAHPSGVRSLAMHPDGQWVATGDRAGTVQVWNLKEEQPVATIQHGSAVNAVAFTMDGLSVASAGADKLVKIWDITTQQQRLTLDGHKGPVYTVAASHDPDNPLIATAGWDGIIRLWDNQGTLVQELKGHEFDVWSVAFCHFGKLLASAGQDGTIRIWDIKTGKEIEKIHAHKPVAQVVRFSHDAKTVISGGRDGFVRLWDLK